MEIEKINTNNKIKSIERIKKIEKIFVVGKGIDSTKEDENNKRQKRQDTKEIFEMENGRKQHTKGLEENENSEKQKVANFKKQYQQRNEAYEKTIEDTIQMYHEKEQQER